MIEMTDNFFVVKKHPNGGYAAVMGVNDHCRIATRKDRKFRTPFDAYDFASSQWSARGVSFDSDVRAEIDRNRLRTS